MLNALCSPLCGIMPKHLMEANENAMAEFPIGTGPYKFVERAEGEYIKMEGQRGLLGRHTQDEVSGDARCARDLPALRSAGDR